MQKWQELSHAIQDQQPVTGLTHNFYKYPARFSPSFARQIVLAFSNLGDLVFDPFMGGGTTLVEARALGRRGAGTDISSLAVFLTETKTSVFSPAELRRIESWAKRLVPKLNLHKPTSRQYEWEESGYLRNISGRQTIMRVFALAGLFLLATIHQLYPDGTIKESSVHLGWFSAQTSQAEPKQRDPYDPRHDLLYRAYLMATIFGVIGALVGLCVIWKQTKSTEHAANAAKDSASAVVSAERAWITIDLRWQENNMREVYGADTVLFNILLVCRNEGRSLAWITEKWVTLKVVDVISEPPDFTDERNIVQHEVQPLFPKEPDVGYAVTLEAPIEPGQRDTKTMLVYGRVKYRTIFTHIKGETTFGFVITRRPHFERLPVEHERYNQYT